MGHAGITATADTYADEQFGNIAVRLTRRLTFRQTATTSCGPNWPHMRTAWPPRGRHIHTLIRFSPA
jgi:hypothetical protein